MAGRCTDTFGCLEWPARPPPAAANGPARPAAECLEWPARPPDALNGPPAPGRRIPRMARPRPGGGERQHWNAKNVTSPTRSPPSESRRRGDVSPKIPDPMPSLSLASSCLAPPWTDAQFKFESSSAGGAGPAASCRDGTRLGWVLFNPGGHGSPAATAAGVRRPGPPVSSVVPGPDFQFGRLLVTARDRHGTWAW